MNITHHEIVNIDMLSQLIDLHVTNFDKTELSLLLGPRFIKEFYIVLINSKHAVINGIYSGEKLIGVVCLIRDNSKFNKELILKYIKLIPLLIIDIKKMYYITNSLLKPLPVFQDRTYWAVTIIDYPFRMNKSAIECLYEILSSEIGEHKYWASVREGNYQSKNMINRFGFKYSKTINRKPENIEIYLN